MPVESQRSLAAIQSVIESVAAIKSKGNVAVPTTDAGEG